MSQINEIDSVSITSKLKKALVSLLVKKDIRNITIKEITELAHVSRGALYFHYQDKYELFKEVVAEIREGLTTEIHKSLKHREYINLQQMDLKVHPTLSYVANHTLFFKAMFDRNKLPFVDFHQFFLQVFKEIILAPANINLTAVERDLYAHYRALSTYAIICYWMKEDMKSSPEMISRQFWELIREKRFYWMFGNPLPSLAEKGRIDRRVIRTRQALQDALMELISEKKDYSAVTVSDITRRSNIRRATFYDHYGDKEDLLKAIVRKCSFDLIRLFTIETNPASLTIDHAAAVLIRLFSYLSANTTIIHFIYNDYGIPDPIPEMFNCLSEFYLEQQINVTAGKELYAYYVSGMIVGLMLYRLQAGKEHSPRFLAQEFIQFLDLKKYKIILL